MKTLFITISLIICSFSQNQNTKVSLSKEVLTATYEGLTENLEFQFVAANGKTYLFEEIETDLDYDLYDELYVGKKFRITWEKRIIRVLDEEDEPTGETREIKVILSLKML